MPTIELIKLKSEDEKWNFAAQKFLSMKPRSCIRNRIDFLREILSNMATVESNRVLTSAKMEVFMFKELWVGLNSFVRVCYRFGNARIARAVMVYLAKAFDSDDSITSSVTYSSVSSSSSIKAGDFLLWFRISLLRELVTDSLMVSCTKCTEHFIQKFSSIWQSINLRTAALLDGLESDVK